MYVLDNQSDNEFLFQMFFCKILNYTMYENDGLYIMYDKIEVLRNKKH